MNTRAAGSAKLHPSYSIQRSIYSLTLAPPVAGAAPSQYVIHSDTQRLRLIEY